MSDAVLKLLPLVEALTLDERHELGGHLNEMDDEVLSQEEWEEAWAEEVNLRIADVEAERSRLIDAEEVFRLADEMLKNETFQVPQ